MKDGISFARLSEIDPNDIAVHMSDPRVAEHMSLLTFKWSVDVAREFIAKKEGYWARDGLGHWAFFFGGRYVGWGAFKKKMTNGILGWFCGPTPLALGNGFPKWQSTLRLLTNVSPLSRFCCHQVEKI